MKIALIGPNANATSILCSNYFGDLPHIVSINEALHSLTHINVNMVKGCDINSTDKSGFIQAIAAAQSSDIAIVVLGLDQDMESEGFDRTSIAFPGVQLSLLQQVYAVQSKTILVLVNGGPLDLSWPKDNIPSILEAFYPGDEGGNGIIDVLFGQYNPSARMPVMVYPESFTDAISMFSMDMRQSPGKTYRFYQLEPIFEFGYGLSYTSFSYTLVSGSHDGAIVQPLDTLTYNVLVQNTGTRNGDVSILVFIAKISNNGYNHNHNSPEHEKQLFNHKSDKYPRQLIDNDCPLKQLVEFKKVNLWIGQNTTLTFKISPNQAFCVDDEGNYLVKSGTYRVTIGDATATFVVPTNAIVKSFY